MSRSLFSPVLMVLFASGLWGQSSQRPVGAVELARAAEVKKLGEEITAHSVEDAKRLTKESFEAHFSEIRSIVDQEILDALNRDDRPESVLEAMRTVMGGKSAFGQGPFAYAANLNGVKTFVAGFDYGYGLAIPTVKVVIDGYRKVGTSYEKAADTDAELNGCGLILEPLNSPRLNETWFLAHGYVVGASGQWQLMRMYSFDGYAFQQVWSAGHTQMETPVVEIGKDTVTITYNRARDYGHRLRLMLHLTFGGVIESATPLPANPFGEAHP